jgi:hypothetical protein
MRSGTVIIRPPYGRAMPAMAAAPRGWARDPTPARSRWDGFRDRVGPLLVTFRQVLGWAVARGLTTASRGSLDGTAIAANPATSGRIATRS